jgi:hypothetical protein
MKSPNFASRHQAILSSSVEGASTSALFLEVFEQDNISTRTMLIESNRAIFFVMIQ